MTNIEAFATAKRKAKFGRLSHLVWKSADGEFFTAPRSPASIKAALIAIGTSGYFTEYAGQTPFRWSWPDGCRMIRNARFGC